MFAYIRVFACGLYVYECVCVVSFIYSMRFCGLAFVFACGVWVGRWGGGGGGCGVQE